MSIAQFPTTRLRRLRHNAQVRQLVRQTKLSVDDLVFPIFIKHALEQRQAIASMPGCFQLGLNDLREEIEVIRELGIKHLLLFGIPLKKDAVGSDAFSDQGIIQIAIPVIKSIAPEMNIITDLCCCEYTDHGHCGIVSECNGVHDLDNDQTLELLAKQAVSHAKAGADIVAPSGMVDGMVHAIRQALDTAGFTHLPILSYSAKYASSLYGPFRQAAEGAPQFGNRRSYQMDAANSDEALRECALDISEGADMIMVKPAHAYLDIIQKVKTKFPELPLGAYHTSGEYAMIKAAGAQQWIDEKSVTLEIITAIKRAGADFIITYFAKDLAAWLRQGV